MAKTVKKAWGKETWLVNGPLYCCKILKVSPGWKCSYHRHHIKDETFLVLSGSVVVTHMAQRFRLNNGMSCHIGPGELHSFESDLGATMLEISTHHDDGDVERVSESKQIEPKALYDPVGTESASTTR